MRKVLRLRHYLYGATLLLPRTDSAIPQRYSPRASPCGGLEFVAIFGNALPGLLKIIKINRFTGVSDCAQEFNSIDAGLNLL